MAQELGDGQYWSRHCENFSFITRRVNRWYWFHPSSWYSEHWWYNSIKNRLTDWWATFSAIFCHQTLFQYLIRCPIERSHEVSSPQDLYLKLSNHSKIWQETCQHCCQCAGSISKQCSNSNCQSRGFETSWDLMIKCLIWYWNGPRSV